MKKLHLVPLAPVAFLAACSSASGPTFSAYELHPRDGVRTFQVDCHGILSSEKTCMKVATRMCDKEPVRVIDSAAPVRASADPRSLVFQCGAAPAPAAAPVPATQAAVEKVVLTGDAYFAPDSATLTPAARAALDKLLGLRGDRHFSRVEVTGYTDATGSDAHNMALSRRRAVAVAAYLRESGLKADSFTTTGKGKADPVGPNDTAEGRASNRRVEISLQK
ncbi:OmpA family protein [Burkholderia multivorans]|uniref:OmpA family protein n=1 Tax=Burkholderia multivorans TaxID=87883 RepID=A0AB37AW51_9BURK|nr:OmpA family protein [Burkholderia multivorans]MBU9589667.1 OmpA family protein [Burkholderia multivorans]PRE47878.1 OmpA family protein [Burkholderia multivorans]PRE53064.1 OmpA family protein [Burkholderia multivorans]